MLATILIEYPPSPATKPETQLGSKVKGKSNVEISNGLISG